jgi:formyl-CoA transferase
MGRPELREDERYRTNAQRLEHVDEVRAVIVGWTRAHTTAEIVDLLGGIVPCGPINTVREIMADPHVARRQMIAEVEQPGSGRRLAIANSPVKMTETPGGVRRRAPLLGEHTREVLAGLDYSDDAIEALVGAAVVGMPDGRAASGGFR